MKTNKKINKIQLALCIIIGVLFSFTISQFIWMASTNSRMNSYSNAILNHAEIVAENLTSALNELNKRDGKACGKNYLEFTKEITYKYIYIKDAGYIKDNKITCSAMWGIIQNFKLKGNELLTKNNVILWNGASVYFKTDMTVYISAKDNSFVVTSPTAFSPFDSPSHDILTTITSHDGKTIMRHFGKLKKQYLLTTLKTKKCSKKYDICVESSIVSNILSTKQPSLIAFISFIGVSSGFFFFYASTKYLDARDSLEYRLKKAIADGLIYTVYQPILHGMTREVAGFEVLARWDDRKLGSVSPNIFLKKAEEIGLQDALNHLIINNALTELTELFHNNTKIYFSFNFETKDLLDNSLLLNLSSKSKNLGILPDQIAIEILESATAEISEIDKGIKKIHSLGHKVFIDDFGSGYSSLAYLANLDVDIIKIDRSFSQAVGTRSPAEMVLRKIHEIAKELDTKIVFEGVETEEQKDEILNFCPDALIQGWVFSKALSISELTEKLKLSKF